MAHRAEKKCLRCCQFNEEITFQKNGPLNCTSGVAPNCLLGLITRDPDSFVV